MKPKILIFIDWYLPAYKAGGPVKSVSNLVKELSAEFDFDIITSDRDFGDTSAFSTIELDNWIDLSDGVRIFYLSKSNPFFFYKKIIYLNSYNYIYINSLYSIRFSFIPLLIARIYSKKVILAPRGMLGKGALNIKKLKKQLFISLYKFLLLDKYLLWQATSIEEFEEIQNVFGKSNIRIVPNIPTEIKLEFSQLIKNQNELKLCFVSRISEKKNLLFALEKLLEFDHKLSSDHKIEFDIYGPIEDEDYFNKCSVIINSGNWKVSKVNYLGLLKPDDISPCLSKYHFLFLPTKNENFGHIIYESFASGTPVIISNQTPWKNLKVKSIGFDFDLAQGKELSNILEECLNMNNDIFSKMKNSIASFIDEIDLRRSSIIKSKRLFEGK